MSVANVNSKSKPNTRPPTSDSVIVANEPTRLSNEIVSRMAASATGTANRVSPPAMPAAK